jgi:ubiquinone/menaquinone biosynthesis C-methylase UbiE
MNENQIKAIDVYEKKTIENPDVEYDKESKVRPAWIRFKHEMKSKFLTISFGKGNINYIEFLHSGYYLPTNYTRDELKKLYDKFAKTYDMTIKDFGKEEESIEFVVKKVTELIKNSSAKILDIGSGTGRGAEIMTNNGFTNITLQELSGEMLNEAKNKTILEDCRFIEGDFMAFDNDNKFDIITSFFAFGSPNYFTEKEVEKGLFKINKMLNPSGIFAGVGIGDTSTFQKFFTKIELGELSLKDNLKASYFIGKKK